MISPAYPQLEQQARRWRLGAGIIWLMYGGLQLAFALITTEGYSLGGLVRGEVGPQIARFLQGSLGAGLLASGLLLVIGLRPAAYLGTAFAACTVLFAFMVSTQFIDRGEKGALGMTLLKMALPCTVLSLGILPVAHRFDERRFRRQQFAGVTLADDQGPGNREHTFPCPHCGVGLVGESLSTGDLAVCPACLKGFTGGVVNLKGTTAIRAATPGQMQCACVQVMRVTADRWGTPIEEDQALTRYWNLPAKSEKGRLRMQCPYCAHDLEIEYVEGKSAAHGVRSPGIPANILKDTGTAAPVQRPVMVNLSRGLGMRKHIFFIQHRIDAPDAVAPVPGRDARKRK